MKSVLFLFIILAVPLQDLFCQGNHKVILYDSWYYLSPSVTKLKPDLKVFTYEVLDSSVSVIAIDRYLHGINFTSEDYRVIPVQEIEMIKFRRKGSKTFGIVIGLTGVVIGAAVGLAAEARPATRPWVMMGSAALGGVIGFGIGLPLSSIKRVYHIRGDVTTYRERRLELIPYTIKYYTK